ncbi:MAG: hypothetical protein ABIZ49_07055 [Opitutaceae bacterium]
MTATIGKSQRRVAGDFDMSGLRAETVFQQAGSKILVRLADYNPSYADLSRVFHYPPGVNPPIRRGFDARSKTLQRVEE